MKHIKQLKIRYGVHVHVLVHVSLRLTARVPKWVFDPSTVGIFTQEIGNDASELLFMERSGSAHFGREKKRKKWKQECGESFVWLIKMRFEQLQPLNNDERRRCMWRWGMRRRAGGEKHP